MTAPPTPADLGLRASTFPSFREGQLDLATRLAFSPARFPVLNAPTGSGKSLVVMTAAKLLDLRTLIVTPQKALQDQYCRDFDIADVRGQANYSCPKFHNCEIGAANDCPLRRSADSSNRCPNILAIDHARNSPAVVTNHAFWMTQGKAKTGENPPPGIGTFDLVVLDEGHGSPERLADFCKVELVERELESLLDASFPTNHSLLSWSEWARAIGQKIPTALKDTGSPRERYRLLSIGRDLAELSGIATDRTTEWIFQLLESGSKATFTPVWATSYAERLLFQSTLKVILASATMLPNTGKYLGFDENESEYIDVASGFDPRNQPFIYCASGVTVTNKSTDSEIRVLTSKYDQIIDAWKGHKGLLHTQSYSLQERILRSSRNRHRFIVCERGGLSGAGAIAELKSSRRDMIVVGPALKEGHDLPDDNARFQILARMPLVNNVTDPVTKARCDGIPAYSMDRTSIDIQQIAGRITRNSRDWGYTLTGDRMWGRVRKEARFPESFVARCYWENDKVVGPPK